MYEYIVAHCHKPAIPNSTPFPVYNIFVLDTQFFNLSVAPITIMDNSEHGGGSESAASVPYSPGHEIQDSAPQGAGSETSEDNELGSLEGMYPTLGCS